MGQGNPERAAQPAGAIRAAVGGQPLHGLHAPYQHRAGQPLGLRHHVEAVVHSIDEVDIGAPWRAEEDLGARGAPLGGMTGQVVLADVGLRLDDAAHPALAALLQHQVGAQQFTGHGEGGTLIEGDGQTHAGTGGTLAGRENRRQPWPLPRPGSGARDVADPAIRTDQQRWPRPQFLRPALGLGHHGGRPPSPRHRLGSGPPGRRAPEHQPPALVQERVERPGDAVLAVEGKVRQPLARHPGLGRHARRGGEDRVGIGHVEGGDLLGQHAVGGGKREQLRHRRPEGLSRGVGRVQQGALAQRVLDEVRPHRVALVLVAVEQRLRCPPPQHPHQLPAEVHRVLEPHVEPLSSRGQVDVGGVSRQEHAAVPVGGRMPGLVAEAGQPERGLHPEVRARDGPHRARQFLQRDRLGHGNPRPLRIEHHGAMVEAIPQGGDHQHALQVRDDERRLGKRLREHDVPQHQAHRRVRPRERNAREGPDGTAGPIRAHHIAGRRVERPAAAGSLQVHLLGELLEPGEEVAPADVHTQFPRARLQEGFRHGLRDEQGEGKRGLKHGEVEPRLQRGVVPQRQALPPRHEPVREPPERQHLQGARVQGQRPGLRHPLRPALEHRHPHARQRQLTGHHQPHRPAPHDSDLDPLACHRFLPSI
ncbi:LigA [Stigmatella aurantiaca DW4/3-1]|uniref:LigA n=1 Tax=Stigmatella aurantiaca (strain DW4/3-1) TaxID=378806 RepID=Q08V56_STIAD|nr:LigA [Stigmatella aurantiaca DW4/3-1]